MEGQGMIDIGHRVDHPIEIKTRISIEGTAVYILTEIAPLNKPSRHSSPSLAHNLDKVSSGDLNSQGLVAKATDN